MLDRERDARDHHYSDDFEVGLQFIAGALGSLGHIEEMMAAYFKGLAAASRKRR